MEYRHYANLHMLEIPILLDKLNMWKGEIGETYYTLKTSGRIDMLARYGIIVERSGVGNYTVSLPEDWLDETGNIAGITISNKDCNSIW